MASTDAVHDSTHWMSGLLAKGLAFDKLAKGLDVKSASDEQGTIKVEILSKVAAMSEYDQQLSSNLEELKLLTNSNRITRQEFYFNLARLLAIKAFKEIDDPDNGMSVDSDVVSAIHAFKSAGRLGTSGVDILAAAILLPESNFLQPCIDANHNIRTLASQFDLPKGVIALRQQIHHIATNGGENLGDVDDSSSVSK